MAAPLSLDLRMRIVRAVEGGSSIREAARRFAVTPSAAIKLMQRMRATGSAAPARYGGHRRPGLEPYEADLRRPGSCRPGRLWPAALERARAPRHPAFAT